MRIPSSRICTTPLATPIVIESRGCMLEIQLLLSSPRTMHKWAGCILDAKASVQANSAVVALVERHMHRRWRVNGKAGSHSRLIFVDVALTEQYYHRLWRVQL
jgi:hypothetical protein